MSDDTTRDVETILREIIAMDESTGAQGMTPDYWAAVGWAADLAREALGRLAVSVPGSETGQAGVRRIAETLHGYVDDLAALVSDGRETGGDERDAIIEAAGRYLAHSTYHGTREGAQSATDLRAALRAVRPAVAASDQQEPA